jgi:arylsulfatase A-like enzyme
MTRPPRVAVGTVSRVLPTRRKLDAPTPDSGTRARVAVQPPRGNRYASWRVCLLPGRMMTCTGSAGSGRMALRRAENVWLEFMQRWFSSKGYVTAHVGKTEYFLASHDGGSGASGRSRGLANTRTVGHLNRDRPGEARTRDGSASRRNHGGRGSAVVERASEAASERATAQEPAPRHACGFAGGPAPTAAGDPRTRGTSTRPGR